MGNEIKRLLIIDHFEDQRKFKEIQVLGDKEDVETLIQRYMFLENPPELVIDARNVRSGILQSMLKFIENYKGSVILFAKEPVPAPIVSRFTMIVKKVIPVQGSLETVFLRGLSRNMLEKVSVIFGVIGESNE